LHNFGKIVSKVIKLSTIKANPNNPRILKDERFKKLCNSIKEFPKMMELRPMVVDAENIVLGGNMRLKALKELGYKEIPGNWVKKAEDLSEDQKKRFVISDNVSFGEWDWDMLANEWDAIELEEWGLDIPNFEPEKVEAEEDDFNGVPPKEPITVLGDLYELNEHRLLCGDSTQTDTFEKLFNGQLADLVVTDPPYNVDYQGGDRTEMKALHRRTDGLKIINDKMTDNQFYQFLYDFFTALGSFTKLGGCWYVWHADMESVNFRTAFKDSGLTPKQNLIWAKDVFVMGRQDYHWQHEPCLYGWKEGASHGWYSDRKQTTILKFERPRISKEHPTMKPVGLFGYQIGNSSKEGDIVADGFGGSGTTMIACDQMKRKGYLVEFDPKYCDVIVSRFIKHKSATGSSLMIKRNGQQLNDKDINQFIENTNA